MYNSTAEPTFSKTVTDRSTVIMQLYNPIARLVISSPVVTSDTTRQAVCHLRVDLTYIISYYISNTDTSIFLSKKTSGKH